MSAARKLKAKAPWQLDISSGAAKSTLDSSCVGIAESLEPQQMLRLVLNSGLRHICQKKGHTFAEELKSANRMIESPDVFFEFPIATVLTPDDLNDASERALLAAECSFNSSNQKQDVLDIFANSMNSKGLAQTVVEDVMSVSDELFTNAIFNAPFIDMLTCKNPGIGRGELSVTFEPGKFARMFLAHDEQRLLIGCQDPYGSLGIERYLSKIQTAYEKGPAAAINFGPGGAGIGSYIIFNAGASLYVGVQPNKATIVCCVIPLGLSNRMRMGLAKHIHWIQR